MKRNPFFYLCVLITFFSITVLATGVFAHDQYDQLDQFNQRDQYEIGEVKKAIEQKKARWTLGETSVSKLTKTERQRRLGSQKPAVTGKERVLVSPLLQLPDKLDWRSYNGSNYVTPVKEQGPCSACWAFAPTGALESNILISRNTPGIDLDLSEQILISCGFSGSCEGGYVDAASDFISTIGLPPETCYPFGAQAGLCSGACLDWTNNTYKMNGWFKVDPSVESIKSALYNLGPLVAIMAAQSDFFYYKAGVYSHSWGSFEGYHTALIVGYDDTDQCFIVKSSWGADWGEAGYFRIAYSEVSSETQFGLWTIAYETDFPEGFPTINGIARSTISQSGNEGSQEYTINPGGDGNSPSYQDGINKAPGHNQAMSVLTGVIRDQSGNAVSGAMVRAGKYAAISTGDGRYYLSSILPGDYIAQVEKEDYSSVAESITLLRNQVLAKDFVIGSGGLHSTTKYQGGSSVRVS